MIRSNTKIDLLLFEIVRLDSVASPNSTHVACSTHPRDCISFRSSTHRFSGSQPFGETDFPRRSTDDHLELLLCIDCSLSHAIRTEYHIHGGHEKDPIVIWNRWMLEMSFTSSSPSFILTVPRAFITVFRIFTKDEWYEIKLEMYALKMSPIIIDSYVISWLFFGGYVLNPLLVGAMVGQVTSMPDRGASMSCIVEYGWSLRSAYMHATSPRLRFHCRPRRDANILFSLYFVLPCSEGHDVLSYDVRIDWVHFRWARLMKLEKNWLKALKRSSPRLVCLWTRRICRVETLQHRRFLYWWLKWIRFQRNRILSSAMRINWMNGFVSRLMNYVFSVSNIRSSHFVSLLPPLSPLVQDRMETQWPLYTAFYYLQLLEIYFENIAERQLLFDFFSISLMALHDKETKSIDPPILSSSDDDDWDLCFSSIRHREPMLDLFALCVSRWGDVDFKNSSLNDQRTGIAQTNEKIF